MRKPLPFDRRWFHTGTFRICALGVALATGLTASAVAASASADHAPSPGRSVLRATADPAIPGQPTSATPQRARPAQNATVTLPTGDRVRLESGSGGTQQVSTIPAGTVSGRVQAPSTFMRFTWRGDQYVIPDAAVPYLHSTLDPRLFDVSYLARAHLGTTGARLPVRITYTSASVTASLPGVHVTRRTGQTATATINTAQAAQLGQSLAGRWRSAYRRHSPAGQLPGIAKITLAPPSTAPALPASPAQIPASTSASATSATTTSAAGVPFYTLTLNAIDLNGNPGTFAGFVQNVDDAGLSSQDTLVTTGAATGSESLSVPKGTYSLAISVETPDPSGTGDDTALVIKPQVTVNSNTTVTLDARTAVPYTANLDTTVNATQRQDMLSVWRTSVTGGGSGSIGHLLPNYGLFLGLVSETPNPAPGFFADRLLATPTTPVTEGSLLFDASTYLSDGAAPGPTYVLDFPYQHSVPSSLTYTVRTTDLTTVHSDIYQSPSPVCVQAGGSTPLMQTQVYLEEAPGTWAGPYQLEFDQLQFGGGDAPGARTDYWYSGDPTLDRWQLDDALAPCPGQWGPIQEIHPGQQLNGTWNKAPLVPAYTAPPYNVLEQADQRQPDPQLTVCTACRQANIGTVDILPFIDSDPTHYSNESGGGGGTSIDQGLGLQFYRNGTLALDDTGGGGTIQYPEGAELPLLPQAATYQLDVTQQIYTDASATIGTDWTFHSGPADPAASLPATESCAPDATRSCSFLPLLFLTYDLPLSYDNQATAGTAEPVNFTVTGQQNAPTPAGVSATVSASFDGGQTWTTPQSATSLGGGKFTSTISQPALADSNGFVSLKVTAKDSSGDSVTQTITDAYGLTS